MTKLNREEFRRMRKESKQHFKSVSNMIEKDAPSRMKFIKNFSPQWKILLSLTESSEEYPERFELINELLMKTLSTILNELLDTLGDDEYSLLMSNIHMTESSALVLYLAGTGGESINVRLTTLTYFILSTFEYLEANHAEIYDKLRTCERDMLSSLVVFKTSQAITLIKSSDAIDVTPFNLFMATQAWMLLSESRASNYFNVELPEEDLCRCILERTNAPSKLLDSFELLYHLEEDDLNMLEYPLAEYNRVDYFLPITMLGYSRKLEKSKDMINNPSNALFSSLKSVVGDVLDEVTVPEKESLKFDMLAGVAQYVAYSDKSSILEWSMYRMWEFMSVRENMQSDMDKLNTKLSKTEKLLSEVKSQNTTLQVSVNNLKKIERQYAKMGSIEQECKALQLEIKALRNQNARLKTHIETLKAVDEVSVPTVEPNVEESTPHLEVVKPINEEPSLDEMLAEINKYRITVLGGPAKFSRRLKEFLPNVKVIDGTSKFGDIRIGNSDYVIVYWKILGHARTMQMDAQAKRVDAKPIHVDTTNKELFIKQVYNGL